MITATAGGGAHIWYWGLDSRARALVTESPMLKIIPYLSAIVSGWAGWRLGRHVDVFIAYVACILFSAAGLYYGRRLVKKILGEA